MSNYHPLLKIVMGSANSSPYRVIVPVNRIGMSSGEFYKWVNALTTELDVEWNGRYVVSDAASYLVVFSTLEDMIPFYAHVCSKNRI